MTRRLSPWILLVSCAALVSGVQQTSIPRIIEHPEDQYVAKNDPATLNCKAEGDPPPEISWYRNGRPVITATENPASHRMLLPSGQLFFLRIIHNKNNKPDVGVYYCNATNPETRVSVISRNATLEMAVMRDDFREEPQNSEVAVGETAELGCKGPRSLPEPRIKWRKDGETIRAEGRFSIRDDGNLVISDSRKEDSGLYSCVAQNIAGVRETAPARLSVREKPKFEKAPQDTQTQENEAVTFQCQASGDPPPTIIWKREQGSIPSSRSSILEDKSLKISKVKVQDEGHYICRAENTVGYIEARAQLSVHSQPSFTVTPRDKVVGVGRRVSFRCEVTGNPPPAVFWNNMEASDQLMFPRQDLGRFSVADDGTLTIEPVRKDDAGEYVCQAISVAGSAFAKAKLEVKDVDPRPPPIIHQGPQNQTLPVNSVAMLQCSASGDPPPTIHWFKDNRQLGLGDPRFALLDSGTLQISDLRRMDTGIFTCKALSETGETAWSAALIVEAPTNPSVIFHRTPEPSTFPGAPSKPALSDITETSMRLSWKSNPNHGASPIFAYTVEYFSHETAEGWIVASDSITEQSYVVRNLRPDTAYMFLVRAQNSHGLSLPSQVTAQVRSRGGVHPKIKPTVPQFDIALVSEKLAGQIIEMKQPEVLRSTAIKVNWEVKRAQRFIEGFHIKYRMIASDQRTGSDRPKWTIETVDVPTATMYVLINLEEYTWYEIRVQPFYMTVEGQDSNPVRVRTFEAAPAAPPFDVRTELKGNNSMEIRWSPPASQHLNGVLEGYKIYMFGNESRFNREIETNASTSMMLVRHLVKGMNYRIQVAAFNRMGAGVKSKEQFLYQNDPYKRSIVSEPWFIGTLIGVIGGTLWFALCIFSIWLYRKRKARKKLHKNGTMSVPVHKSEDPSRLGTLFSPPHYLHKDNTSPPSNQDPGPDVTKVGSHLEAEKEPLYNCPNVNQPPMKTFYNKHAAARQQAESNVAPYATTTLAMSQNMCNSQAESAFRPIQQTPYNDLKDEGHYEQQGLMSPMSEYSMAEDEEAQRCLLPSSKQPILFLPPPPEHPPPSDIGTPPDSPTMQMRHYSPAGGHYSDRSGSAIYQSIPSHPGSLRGGTPDMINANFPPRANSRDAEQIRCNPHYQPHPAYSGTLPPACYSHGGHSPPAHPGARPASPKFQTMAHASQPHDGRAYSPRAMSEPENRGPTPPVRGYKLVPIRDNASHYSDTEGVPAPPMRHMMPHSPPSPAPEDPTMERGIQSSLPSLASECLGQERLMEGHDSDTYHEDDYEHQSPDSSAAGDAEGTGSMLASWASVTDHSDNCSSVRSSAASGDSDSSFFAEADFASAVAKAAELSGLTVVGSTVIDNNAREMNREKVKRPAKHRQRAKRPTSPYSTDSNYSAVQMPPHKPYPKSERKRQLQEHSKRPPQHRGPPPLRSKPQIPPHVSDLPSYNRPNFPSPGSSSGMPLGGGSAARVRNGMPSPTTSSAAKTPADHSADANVRSNPLAAFDTRDTPIV